MNKGEEPDSFRNFYNKVFLASVKDFLSKYNSYGYINPNSTPIRPRQQNLLQKMHLDSPFKATRGVVQHTVAILVDPLGMPGQPIMSRKGSHMSPLSHNLVCIDSPLPSHERGLFKR